MSDQVSALLHDRAGNLWVGTPHGLDRFDPEARSFHHYRRESGRPGTLHDNQVSALYEDRRGVLWVATFEGGLHRFDRSSETFTAFRHDADRPAICSSCKKIRDDAGSWNEIEAYIDARSEATFTHAICPVCAETLYDDLETSEPK